MEGVVRLIPRDAVFQGRTKCGTRHRSAVQEGHARTTANNWRGAVKFCITKCTNLKNKKGFLNGGAFMLPDPRGYDCRGRDGGETWRWLLRARVWTNKNDKE